MDRLRVDNKSVMQLYGSDSVSYSKNLPCWSILEQDTDIRPLCDLPARGQEEGNFETWVIKEENNNNTSVPCCWSYLFKE